MTSLQFKPMDFFIPVSSKSDARQVDSENPMEDKSSFPAAGREETGGSKLGRSEEGPKQQSSRCPCRLRSTQLQRAQALTVSLKIKDTVKNFWQLCTWYFTAIEWDKWIFKFVVALTCAQFVYLMKITISSKTSCSIKHITYFKQSSVNHKF